MQGDEEDGHGGTCGGASSGACMCIPPQNCDIKETLRGVGRSPLRKSFVSFSFPFSSHVIVPLPLSTNTLCGHNFKLLTLPLGTLAIRPKDGQTRQLAASTTVLFEIATPICAARR